MRKYSEQINPEYAAKMEMLQERRMADRDRTVTRHSARAEKSAARGAFGGAAW